MAELRNILGRRDPELWIVTAARPSTIASEALPIHSGMVATSVVSVSIVADMPRVLVAVSNQHLTWRYMRDTGVFTLHLLVESNIDLVWRFGLQSGRNADKFQGLNPREINSNAESPFVVLPECAAWLGGKIESEVDIGDRSLFVAEVTHGEDFRPESSPLSMSRLVEIGDAAQLGELRRQTEAQAARDRLAVQQWRKSNLA